MLIFNLGIPLSIYLEHVNMVCILGELCKKNIFFKRIVKKNCNDVIIRTFHILPLKKAYYHFYKNSPGGVTLCMRLPHPKFKKSILIFSSSSSVVFGTVVWHWQVVIV